jgi:hypothetical protein
MTGKKGDGKKNLAAIGGWFAVVVSGRKSSQRRWRVNRDDGTL